MVRREAKRLKREMEAQGWVCAYPPPFIHLFIFVFNLTEKYLAVVQFWTQKEEALTKRLPFFFPITNFEYETFVQYKQQHFGYVYIRSTSYNRTKRLKNKRKTLLENLKPLSKVKVKYDATYIYYRLNISL